MLTVTKTQNVSFKAGATPEIKRMFSAYTAPNIEKVFKKQYNVNANFENNRAVACCCATVSDIFDYLSKNFNLPFMAKPPNIRMFSQETLIHNDCKDALGFCITDSYQVLKGEPVFELRSLFLNSKFKTISQIDESAENNFAASKWNSTPHFLHTYIHEWVHNLHEDWLFRKFGYDGACPMARQRYNSYNGQYYDPNPFISGIYQAQKIQQTHYTPEARKLIAQQISQYAAGQTNQNTNQMLGGNPFEVVAEYLTKKIVEVLNPKTLLPTKNPFCQNGKEDAEIIDIIRTAWEGIINW